MLKLKEFYNKIPPILKNKYTIVIFLFSIWITFLDDNNLIVLYQRLNTLESKQAEIDNLKADNKEMEERLERLSKDPEELERFARENFLMKKEGEDIIIIRSKSNE